MSEQKKQLRLITFLRAASQRSLTRRAIDVRGVDEVCDLTSMIILVSGEKIHVQGNRRTVLEAIYPTIQKDGSRRTG
jgi:hypothetical protein